MRKVVVLVFAVLSYTLNAQKIDYNTSKGVAIDGFDVVAYFSNKATEGNSKYVAKHDGVNYKFSSQHNLETFKTNPTKYIPQYGGYCAYALGAKGKKVDVDPETFEIRDGKLFLFYNSWGSNALESWLEESPNILKAKADKHWEKLKFDN
ncbi:MAG: YHS domain-containing (seleno)protein [Psychroserpens sp.]|uniref:YHS domain-containing (seleno)protein n=1 Tax=Psychroserpens sp. TaxID=2020870 RepID=UPI003C73F372